MSCRYIVLLDANALRSGDRVSTAQEMALRTMGMRRCPAAEPITLFVAEDTPTLATPGGGILIGHLFSNDGTPIRSGALPNLPSPEQFTRHLLTHYWGEYVLLQTTAKRDSELEILRDPSGGVSGFHSIQDGIGFFTSDISLATSLGLYRKQVDWAFISQALAYPYLKTRRTGLADVQELLPGCSLILRSTSATVRQDWSPWEFVATEHRHNDPDEAAAEIRNAVASVVKAWANIDKTILLELSGGLDSSIVGACLKWTDAHVSCCNLVTPVPGADERQYASLMADYLGVELRANELCFENARFDFAPPLYSVTPRIGVLQYVANEVKEAVGDLLGVASYFSGGGGDTVFCYRSNAAPAADAFKERGIGAGLTAIRDLATLHQCTIWKAGRLTLRKLLRGPRPPCRENRSFLAPTEISDTPERHPWHAAPADALPGDYERIADLAGTQLFRDTAPRGAKRWLRLPLLSQPVVEACLKVPTWMCISGGENRAVARAAFADVLPQGILNRRSKGNFTIYSGAVFQRSKQQMRDFLLTGHLQERRLLDTVALQRFFESDLPPRDESFMRMFDLCMVENWIRHQS